MADTSQSQDQTQPSLKNLTQRFGSIPGTQLQSLQDLVRHHVESFNFLLEGGLQCAVEDIRPQELVDPKGRRMVMALEGGNIGYPTVDEKNVYSKSVQIFPSECRERATTYKAKLSLTLKWELDGKSSGNITKVVGQIPVMVKSKNCRLYGLSPKELVKHHEEVQEWGGYFIVNGNEKIIRMLIMPRRNYPMAIVRQSWKQKGPLFTEFGVTIRCVRRDQTASNMTLHYFSDGTCHLMFARNKEQYFVPVVMVLKALVDISDVKIFMAVMLGEEKDTMMKGCMEGMLTNLMMQGLTDHKKILKYIGERFRLKAELPESVGDEDVARHILK